LSEGESYVPIFRSLLGHRYMKDAAKLQFWVWCLLKATYQEHKILVGNKTVVLHPGQFVFGRKAAAKELGTTEQKIRTLLNFFSSQEEQKLTIESTKQFSVITVIEYASYVDKAKKANQRFNQQPTNGQPTPNHKQEGLKKGKEEKPKNIELPAWVPRPEWEAYVEMRKAIKAPMTDGAKKLAIGKLKKMQEQGENPASVLEQSIFNSWKGLFVVKEEKPKSSLRSVGGYIVR